MDPYTPVVLTHFPQLHIFPELLLMGLFIVAALSFGFGVILASVTRLQLLILSSFRAVLGASLLLLFVAFYENETDIVCESVKKCNNCSRIRTGKFLKIHKCSYSECTNCLKYVGKNHKCFLKNIKALVTVCLTKMNHAKITN